MDKTLIKTNYKNQAKIYIYKKEILIKNNNKINLKKYSESYTDARHTSGLLTENKMNPTSHVHLPVQKPVLALVRVIYFSLCRFL